MADATDKRIGEIETELLVKQKYDSSLVELEKDLAMCNNHSSYSYAAAKVLIDKLENWKSFISAAQDLPKSMEKKLEERILVGEKQLNVHLQSIQDTITNLFASAKDAKDLQSLLDVEKRLGSITNYEPPESILSEASRLIDIIHEVQKTVMELPSQIDQLAAFSVMDPVEFSSVIHAEKQSKLSELLKKQSAWIKLYIISAEDEVSTMPALLCTRWLSQTQSLPNYLDQQSIARYHNVRDLVDERLHKCRVQGVVSLFKALSKEEKEECLMILQNEP